MDNPLHAIQISRSGAGKSLLVEITESLCPPEELEKRISEKKQKEKALNKVNILEHSGEKVLIS